MRVFITVFIAFLLAQNLLAQSNLTQKQIEKENYQEVTGFSDFQNDTLKPDKFPMYPGGQDGLIKDVGKNIKYPPAAREKGIEGKVVVAFVVNAKGEIEDIEIMESANPDLDAEAIRVIKNLAIWVPGFKNEKPVPVPFIYPFTFRLK